jgi:hypothetical protein
MCIRTILFVFAALIACGLVHAPAAPLPKYPRLSQYQLEEKVYGHWAWIRCSYPNGNIGCTFGPHTVDTWDNDLLTGGHQGGIKLNAYMEPMWFDFHLHDPNTKKPIVIPGICRFEGDKLVVISAASKYCGQLVKKDGNYEGRPTVFIETKENGYRREVFKRCADCQIQFPDGFFKE